MKEVKCPQLPEKIESSIVDKMFCDTFVFGRGCGHKKTCSAYALLCEKDEKPIAKSDEFVIGEKDGT